jgi:hypothetical protein
MLYLLEKFYEPARIIVLNAQRAEADKANFIKALARAGPV